MRPLIMALCFIAGYFVISKIIDSIRGAALPRPPATMPPPRPEENLKTPILPSTDSQTIRDVLALLALAASPGGQPDAARWPAAMEAAAQLLGPAAQGLDLGNALRSALHTATNAETHLLRLKAAWSGQLPRRIGLVIRLHRVAEAGGSAAPPPDTAALLTAADRILK